MYARRFRRGRRYPIARVTKRYSSETTSVRDGINFEGGGQVVARLVGAIDTQGIRKVKNFRLRMTVAVEVPLFWALVYVPQGMNPSNIAIGSATQPMSLYEPNQNVIMSGTIEASKKGFAEGEVPGTLVQSTSRLARNLGSGDYIALIIKNPYDVAIQASVALTLNYAIAY